MVACSVLFCSENSLIQISLINQLIIHKIKKNVKFINRFFYLYIFNLSDYNFISLNSNYNNFDNFNINYNLNFNKFTLLFY